jgi:hypothetical protein
MSITLSGTVVIGARKQSEPAHGPRTAVPRNVDVSLLADPYITMLLSQLIIRLGIASAIAPALAFQSLDSKRAKNVLEAKREGYCSVRSPPLVLLILAIWTNRIDTLLVRDGRVAQCRFVPCLESPGAIPILSALQGRPVSRVPVLAGKWVLHESRLRRHAGG